MLMSGKIMPRRQALFAVADRSELLLRFFHQDSRSHSFKSGGLPQCYMEHFKMGKL